VLSCVTADHFTGSDQVVTPLNGRATALRFVARFTAQNEIGRGVDPTIALRANVVQCFLSSANPLAAIDAVRVATPESTPIVGKLLAIDEREWQDGWPIALGLFRQL
jgi:hypothetical protein